MSLNEIVRGMVEERRAKNSKYKRFKQAVLGKYGVQSPEELEPQRKKQFYKYIDSQWKRFKTTQQPQNEELNEDSNAIWYQTDGKLNAEVYRIKDASDTDLYQYRIYDKINPRKPLDTGTKETLQLAKQYVFNFLIHINNNHTEN